MRGLGTPLSLFSKKSAEMELIGPNRYTRLNTGQAMAILDINNLSAGYENGFVIHDITLSVPAGQFVAILGRNGSGKSTLIRALLGLLRNVKGRSTLGTRETSSMNRREIAAVAAYVPQLFEPVFEFKVRDIVLMGRYARQKRIEALSPEDKKAIDEALTMTDLLPHADKQLGHLSGGERQRVFIARALAQDTPLLMLDEPSLHLDISYQVEIYGILKTLQREKGKTIIAAEHNINLAVSHADRLIFLKDGALAADGPPEGTVDPDTIRRIFEAEVDIGKNTRSGLPELSLIAAGWNK